MSDAYYSTAASPDAVPQANAPSNALVVVSNNNNAQVATAAADTSDTEAKDQDKENKEKKDSGNCISGIQGAVGGFWGSITGNQMDNDLINRYFLHVICVLVSSVVAQSRSKLSCDHVLLNYPARKTNRYTAGRTATVAVVFCFSTHAVPN